MILDLKITFKDENGDTIKYEFGTRYHSEKDKTLVDLGSIHSEVLEVKSKVIALLETLF
mgnify:CR=1 FL=1